MADTVTVALPGAQWKDQDGAVRALTLTVMGKKTHAVIVLPWIPDELERAGFARTWEQTPRPGLTPLNYTTGASLRTHTFSVQVSSPEPGRPVSDLLAKLENAAMKGTTVSAALGSRLLGLCKISGLTVRETDWDANAAAIEAVAEVELTETSDAPSVIGPVPPLVGVSGVGTNMAVRGGG